MKTHSLSLVLGVLLAGAASVASQVLSLDFDERGLASPNTFPGFSSFVIASNTSATAAQTVPTVRTFGALTVTLSGNGTTPSYDDRLRAVPTNNLAAAPDFDQALLLRDVVFSGDTTTNGGLNIQIDGLTAGEFYRVTIWSYDNSSTGNRVSDWFANGLLARAAYAFNGSVLPTNNLQYQFSFKIAASAGGQLLILGRRNPATSSAGGVFLNALQLEVTTPDPPVITTHPTGAEVFTGDIVRLFAGVGGTVPFSFQWLKDGNPISDATNLNYAFAAPADGSGNYSLVVTNISGSVTSNPALVTVQPVVNIESGRISYWPLDGLDSNPPDLTTPDLTASANHFYLTNMDAANLAQGVGGNGLTFNGTDEFLARIHTNSVSLPIYSFPSYTVALWVKGNFAGQSDRRVFSESANTNNSILLNIGTDSAGTNGAVDIFIRNNDGGTPLNHRKSSLIAFDGNWHHIAWVDNHGVGKVYVDGVPDTNDFTYTRGVLTPNITTLGAILRATPGSFFGGMIDDAVVYRRSLAASEVLSLVQCGPSVTGTAPVITQDPQSRTNNVGSNPSFSVAVSGSARLNFQWLYGGNPLAGQTNSTLVLSNVALSQAGDYSVTVSNCVGAATSAVAILTVNRVPIAQNKGAATTAGQAVGLLLSKLLHGASDPDGDPFTLVNLTPTSTNGGAVTLTSSNIIYAPLPGFVGVDRFSFSLDDGRGGVTPVAVEILVVSGNLPSANQVSLVATPGGGYQIRFAGVPGSTYQVQRSTDLNTWTTLATVVAPLHGIIEYEDAAPPQPAAFYRTIAP